MKKRILRYLKHVLSTLLILLIAAILIGLYHGASANYSENPLKRNLDKEGPYVFFESKDTLSANYIRGNKDDGFYFDQIRFPKDSAITIPCYFQIDSTQFKLTINTNIQPPNTTYQDRQPILAISDIEGSYRTFRDFLINNKVIDKELNWIFGRGHLVLVGDFVDRGWSTTQVLWLIYKLEQDAQKEGGVVHYILGNHELKNMQGHFQSAADKYYAVAAFLGKQHHNLYDTTSFLGRWMESKNSMELINGNLFTHGGIHPEVADSQLTLDEINQLVRSSYRKTAFPKPEKDIEGLLTSNKTGLCWYRGYFKEDLTQAEVDKGLQKFNANAVVVGHTLQSKVNRQYDGKVIGIDVKHPKDYMKSWPYQASEGLLIKDDKYYRVFSDGQIEEI